MYLKTTSINFLKYGTTLSEITPRKKHIRNNTISKDISSKSVSKMYLAKEDVYFRVNDGIVLLLCTNSLNETIDSFVVHKIVCIKKGVYYNFISITDTSNLELSTLNSTLDEEHDLFEPYTYRPIVSKLKVKEIYSYYYVIRSTDYNFPGETHDHWELTMINDGTLHTIIEDKEYALKNNELILYAPGQFHTQYTSADETTSYITVIFDMDIDDPDSLKDRIFKSGSAVRSHVDDFLKNTLREDEYDDDLMVANLQMILIELLRSNRSKTTNIAITPVQQKFDSEILDGILNYIQENIYNPLTVEDLCRKFSLSRSSLQLLFKNSLNVPPKQYISNLKLTKSKELIKQNNYTISEIAVMCGFSTIHYFSRKFKEEFGITPSDYAKSYMR